jgi:hypothetical protein
MVYISSNAKKVTEGQKLTFRLICQDGKRAELAINPKFVQIPNAHERHNIGAQITDKLPDGVEFVIDSTTVQRDTSNPTAGVIVRGGMNDCVVNFNGEQFPLFSVQFGDVGIQLSVDELQAALTPNKSYAGSKDALNSFQSKLEAALKQAKTVPGEHGTLYFLAMPVEFGGGLIESYAATPSYGLE